MVEEICQLQRAFASQFFNRRGIDMAEDKVQGLLAVKAKGIQVCAVGENIAQLDMLVFQTAFLSGPHGVAEKYPSTSGAV